jgi:RNA polymerase sigma factor (sigma-70 family)
MGKDMPTSPMSEVIQDLRRVMLRDEPGLTDGQLLEDYLGGQDAGAFEALVRRHGPMVWGVCRRVLGNHHDAEDAFQATFLVLVRKAASVSSRELLGNWLFGVAQRTALKAKALVARREGREKQVSEMPEPAVAEPDLWSDVQPLLDEELSRLPERYRVVIVLCDLEGKTRKEVARQLGCPEGTVAGRLARARALLAKRLARRGVAVAGGTLATVLAQNAASAGMPTAVVSSTIKAAGGRISARVAILTEGVLKAMFLHRLKSVLIALVVVMAALAGGSVYLLPTHAGEKDSGLTIPLNTQSTKKAEEAVFNKAILAMEAKFWKAAMKFDAESMEKIYAADFLAVSERGQSGKAACVEATKQYRSANVKFRNIRVIRLSKDAAVVTYRLDHDVYSRDRTLIMRQRNNQMSNAWARRDGRWVFVFSQMTQMP